MSPSRPVPRLGYPVVHGDDRWYEVVVDADYELEFWMAEEEMLGVFCTTAGVCYEVYETSPDDDFDDDADHIQILPSTLDGLFSKQPNRGLRSARRKR
jgi:hypothetical protein